MKRTIAIMIALMLWAGTAWADITTGLVGYWPLTNSWMQSATVVSDIGSGGNHGTLVNGPTVGAEYTTLDGGTQYILAGNTNDITTGDFTLSCWFNVDTVGSLESLIRKRDSGALAAVSGYFLAVNTGDYIVAWISDGTANSKAVSSAAGAFSTGSWNMATIVADRAGNAQIYVNGLPSGSPVDISAIGSLTNTIELSFGAVASGLGNFIDGSICHLRLYSRALSADDVAELDALDRNPLSSATLAGPSITGVSMH